MAEAVQDGVKITSRVEITYNGIQAIIPKDLIVEHQGQNYLKLRATSRQVVYLLTKKSTKVYQTLAHSKLLAGLLDQRNEAYLYEKPEEDVFDAKPEEPPAKKVKRKHFPNTVKIQVESQEVEVFMDGQRPTRSPLTVAMVPEQMQAIFNHLQKDLEAK